MNNKAWTLVEMPKDRSTVGCRWVFKVKYNADGKIERYKARLVAKEYSQEAGVDYDEIYSPVARYKSIRTILAITNQLDEELHQLDVQTEEHGNIILKMAKNIWHASLIKVCMN